MSSPLTTLRKSRAAHEDSPSAPRNHSRRGAGCAGLTLQHDHNGPLYPRKLVAGGEGETRTFLTPSHEEKGTSRLGHWRPAQESMNSRFPVGSKVKKGPLLNTRRERNQVGQMAPTRVPSLSAVPNQSGKHSRL